MMIYFKVKPNQRFDRLEQTGDGWQIRLRAPAVDNKANIHLVEFLSGVLELPKSSIRVKKGLTARTKGVEVDAGEEYVNQQLRKFQG